MPVLVDTSVWIDHLRSGVPALELLLSRADVRGHPWVTGEVALGSLRDRHTVLRLLAQLPTVPVATPTEVLTFVEARQLAGVGIGYVDAHLLASTALAGEVRLWSRDSRLVREATRLGVAYGGEGR